MDEQNMRLPYTREEILTAAKNIVTGHRTDEYGQPEDSFSKVAKYWSVYLDREITSLDVANMMMLLKMARMTYGGGSIDNYVDIAGYAACGGEIFFSLGK